MRSFLGMLFVLYFVAGSPIAQRPSPGLHVADFEAPPESLELLWDEADIVARVRVQSGKSRALTMSNGAAIPLTDYAVAVSELLKGTLPSDASGALTISLPVAEVSVGGQVQRLTSGGLRKLVPNREYVVFLDHWPHAGTYLVSYGPASVYELEGDSVVIPERVTHYAAFKGRARVPRVEMDALFSRLRTRR